MGVSNFFVLELCAREDLCARLYPAPGPSPSNPSPPLAVPTLTQGSTSCQGQM